VRYTQAVPEAATKWQAEQAEAKAKNEVYEGKYGREPSSISLKEFVEKVFLPWSKTEKRSWRNDISRSKPIVAFFKNKKMRDITNLNMRPIAKTAAPVPTGAAVCALRLLLIVRFNYSLASSRLPLSAVCCRRILARALNWPIPATSSSST
jgi:hypothetical protein